MEARRRLEMVSPLACRVCLDMSSQVYKIDKYRNPNLCSSYKLLSGLEDDICDICICEECEQRLIQAWILHQQCVCANEILNQLAREHSEAWSPPEYLKQDLDTWPQAEANLPIESHSKVTLTQKEYCKLRRTKASIKSISKSEIMKPKTRRTIIEMDQYFSQFVTVYKMTQEEATKDMERRRQSQTFLLAPHKCLPCGRGFHRSEAFTQHLLKHDPENGSFECDYCNIRCKTRHKLLDHFRLRHTLKIDCKKCSYSCNNRNLARQHESWHNGTLYKCKFCNEKFSQYAAKQQHVKLRHPSEYYLENPKNYAGTRTEALPLKSDVTTRQKEKRPRPDMVCETCGKVFHTNWDFDTHRRKHTGEKPFECLICHKKFALKGILKVHSRIHARQKPYVCAVCGKDFAEKSNMLRHAQTHLDSKPIPCDLCEKQFKNASSLKVHIKYVHMKRPYPVRKKEKKEEQLKSRVAMNFSALTS